MKEVSELYNEELQTSVSPGNSFTGFYERTTGVIPPDEMFRSGGYSFTQTKNRYDHVPALPVNNYLKTVEEMEVEFLFIMGSRKVMPDENEHIPDTYGRIIKRAEVYSTIHNLDNVLSGPMEENY